MPQWDSQQQQLCAVYTESEELTELTKLLTSLDLFCQPVSKPQDLENLKPAIILLDVQTTYQYDINIWRKYSPGVIILTHPEARDGADLILPVDNNDQMCLKMFQLALQQWSLKAHTRQLREENQKGGIQLQEMASIGIALSAEKNLHTLLEKILVEGKKMAGCDAASLFLVNETGTEERELVFKLALNDSVEAPLEQVSFPLNDKSIGGYVATHGYELNIADAYLIPPSAPYKYNYDFDDQMGYRCVSLLALPMHNYRGESVGVVEFINCKKDTQVQLLSPAQTLENTRPFEENTVVLLRALASQSAIAIDHFMLLESINRLFEGFVNASVAAIEQRDPTTSGHSFRVADLCVELAQSINHSHLTRFRHTIITEKDLRQLRYAALLHDFGKVGVRENVLMKSKKLSESQFQNIRARFKYINERMHHNVYYELYRAQKRGELTASNEQELLERLNSEQKSLEKMLLAITKANEPALLEDSGFESLVQIHQYSKPYVNPDTSLLNESELAALSIRRGSLTELERKEIEAHVEYTLDFLKLIPWTPELSRIPDIAGSHHEKLNGSGYPNSLHEDEIPLPSKIMTVCDIYDALTASDRPYKKAISTQRAFSILQEDTNRGLLDPDMVRLFIDSDLPKCLSGKSYPQASSPNTAIFHHHVCDLDLHQHY